VVTVELKKELPIDQEATRLKDEANEQEANKEKGWIDINIDNTSIKIVTKKNDTPTIPSLLIDGSGENKIKIIIKDIKEKNELINEENDNKNNSYKFSDLVTKTDEITSDLEKQIRKINELNVNFDNTWSKNKQKRKTKEIKKEVDKLDEMISENEFKFEVDTSFTRDVKSKKREIISYKYSYTKDNNNYVDNGWVAE